MMEKTVQKYRRMEPDKILIFPGMKELQLIWQQKKQNTGTEINCHISL